MRQIILIIHNVRSSHNAGSLLRSADGLGVKQVIFSGYTPYPKQVIDERLPHIADKVHRQIQKTALGSEYTVNWIRIEDVQKTIDSVKQKGYELAILEQTKTAISLNTYEAPAKVALFVGNEVEGVENDLLELIKTHLQIPMLGPKESFNVSVAGAIALYHLRYS
ncbi:TrmH family RNA methyltransferase [Candidatus Saccharibacteria bacterium]|nr:TrmH family RNA methyltransferase [Candidatus Saccharibacteria bacterium]